MKKFIMKGLPFLLLGLSLCIRCIVNAQNGALGPEAPADLQVQHMLNFKGKWSLRSELVSVQYGSNHWGGSAANLNVVQVFPGIMASYGMSSRWSLRMGLSFTRNATHTLNLGYCMDCGYERMQGWEAGVRAGLELRLLSEKDWLYAFGDAFGSRYHGDGIDYSGWGFTPRNVFRTTLKIGGQLGLGFREHLTKSRRFFLGQEMMVGTGREWLNESYGPPLGPPSTNPFQGGYFTMELRARLHFGVWL